jgi:hypothetical protein
MDKHIDYLELPPNKKLLEVILNVFEGKKPFYLILIGHM